MKFLSHQLYSGLRYRWESGIDTMEVTVLQASKRENFSSHCLVNKVIKAYRNDNHFSVGSIHDLGSNGGANFIPLWDPNDILKEML